MYLRTLVAISAWSLGFESDIANLTSDPTCDSIGFSHEAFVGVRAISMLFAAMYSSILGTV
jgi:hypothetical protein